MSNENSLNTLIVKYLGLQQYKTSWQAMQQFTAERHIDTPDECWLLEHFPVFTQGQNGKPENILNPGEIPVIQTDRGGQVTYHGPGQLMVYVLIDLKRRKMNVREFVTALEEIIILVLESYHITAYAKREAPGVYIYHDDREKKIASLGLRIRKGFSFHGIAFNVDMDLAPFDRIHPCGFSNLHMTQLSALIGSTDLIEVGNKLITYLKKKFRYTSAKYIDESESGRWKQNNLTHLSRCQQNNVVQKN